MTFFDRLTSKFTIGDDCWEWTAAKDTGGYGQIKVDGKNEKAHRCVYELLIGPIPAKLELDHSCSIRYCVNPKHLEPVTHAENVRRSGARGNMGQSNKRKKACPQGHPYSGINSRGDRFCHTCMAAQARARRAAK